MLYRVPMAVAAFVLAASGAFPVLAADWTGFYAGIYAGGATHSDSQAEAAFVIGQFSEGTGPDSPDGFHNFNGVDPLTFELLSQATLLFNTVGAGQAVGVVGEGSVGYNPNLWVGGVVGYSFGNGVRVEGDWSHGVFDANDFEIDDIFAGLYEGDYITPDDYYTWGIFDGGNQPGGGFPLDGDVTLQSVADFYLANVWFDLDNESMLAPYIGGGAGLAYVRTNVDFGDGTGTGSGQWALAGQLGTGIRVDLNDTSFLDFGYRYKLAGETSSRFVKVHSLNNNASFVGYGAEISGTTAVQTVQIGYNLIIQ